MFWSMVCGLFFDVEAQPGARWSGDASEADLASPPWRPGSTTRSTSPAYSAFADIAQVIYLDHRGNGRSEAGPRGVDLRSGR